MGRFGADEDASSDDSAAVRSSQVSRAMRAPGSSDDGLAAGVHEIQNALTGVLGWLEIARGATDPDLHARAMRVIETGVQRARTLVSGLANPAERFSVRPRVFTVDQLVADVFEFVQPRCASVGVALEMDVPADPVHAVGDPERLVQILTNLVLNALDAVLALPDRGADRGRVRIALTTDDAYAMLRVSDDGTGIDDDTLTHVFEPFFTTHPSASGSRKAGSGLGLAICRQLADAMGARLELHSEFGRGTDVTLTLPREGTVPSVKPPPDEPGLRAGTRILVIDDEPAIREMLEVALTLRGAEVATAASLREARHALAHHAYDVIVVDDTLGNGDSGSALVVDISRVMPGMSCVLMTGAPSVEHLSPEAARFLLRKPFALDEVVKVVGRAIAASDASKPPAT